MKIAFVNDLVEHIGVEYISAVLKESNHQTSLFVDPRLFVDENHSIKSLGRFFDCKKRLISDLKAYKPGLIGISVNTDTYQWACTMAKMIKQEMDVPIIFGGIHPTSVPERVIRNYFVDMVCVGEGEYPMLELANSMAKGQVDYSIKNIWFKRNGQIIQNEVRPLIGDLDSLPMPDKDLYYLDSPNFIKNLYFINIGRGCLQRCSYCCHSFLKKLYANKGKYLRHRTVDNVIKELLIAKNNYKIKLIRFWDDHFFSNFSTEWRNEFRIKYKEKIRLPFICYLYPAGIDTESVQYLKDCGCIEVSLGIQTWDQNLRESILHRRIANKDIETLAGVLKNNNINITVDFICGIPGQTERELIDFAGFCKRNKFGAINVFGLKFYPNTDLSFEMKEKGHITALEYDEFIDNIKGTSFNLSGDISSREVTKLKCMILLARIFPYRFFNYIIQKKILHRFFANIQCEIFGYFYNRFMFSHDKRIFFKTELSHYMYFIKKRLNPRKARLT